MNLSRTVVYAMQAVLQLASCANSAPVSCKHLASKASLPERFLPQILRTLVNHGVLESTRGIDGGYLLARPAEEISLLDIIEAIEGPVSVHIASGNRLVSASHKKLDTAIRDVTNVYRQELEMVRLPQLLTDQIGELGGETLSSTAPAE